MKKSYIHFVYMLIIAVFSYTLLNYTNSEKTADVMKKYRSASSPKASFKMKKARADYLYRMLMDPETKNIPQGIRKKELEFAQKLQEKNKTLKKTSLINDLGWQEAGPNNVGGRTRALAVDVANPNIIIAGGVSGGIWKSTDKGNSWIMKSSTSQILSVTSLAQDPRPGHTNIWYYGTGEYAAGPSSASGIGSNFTGDGVYKSMDNGETWEVLQSTLSSNFTSWNSPFDFVSKIEVSPTTGSIFIATYGIGIMRSTDGGASFSLVIGGSGEHLTSDLSIAADGSIAVVLASPFQNVTPKNQPGVYKSLDDGATWTKITPTTFPMSHEKSAIEIAPSNNKLAYIVTFAGQIQNSQYEDIKFYKIDLQSGNSEERTNNLPVFNSPYGGEERINSQRGYNLTLAIKPDDENFVMIGATSLFRSTNGFATKPNNVKLDWIGGYHPTYFGYPNFHPDIHSYSFDPNNPNAMWWGHDGGLSYTADITNQSYQELFPWENKNNGYNVTQFYHISIPNKANDNRIMGGTQDNGTPYLEFDGAIGPQIVDASTGDGAYSYFGNNYAFTSVQNGILIRIGYNNGRPSQQSGYTEFTPTDASGQNFINPFAIDPNDENIMYYPAGNNLWRNNQIGTIPDNQQGTTVGWSKLDGLALPSGYLITTIAASESNPNHRIYYGGIDFSQQSSGAHKLYRLDNANTAVSSAVEITIPGTTQWSYPNSIVINPDNADEIIVVYSNYNIVGVYHSLNGGQSFTAIEGNLEGDETLPGPSIRSAAILPTSNGNQYFLATSTGVYSSNNLNGTNTVWSLEGANSIGNVVVSSIASRSSDGRIVAGTHGRGAFAALAGSGTGGGAAIANVNINSLTLQAKPGQSSSTNFILSNNGTASLNYNISVSGSFGGGLNKLPNPKFELKSPDFNSEEYNRFRSKSNIIKARRQENNYKNNSVTASEYRKINGNDYLLLDDGDMTADTYAGLGNGLDFDCYNEFFVTGSSFELETIEFFIKTEQAFSNFINAAIYNSNDSLLQFGVFAFDLSSNGKWFDATLNPKIKFNNGESFKVEIYSYSLINQPMGTDIDAQIPNNSYFFNPLTAKWENLNTQPGFQNGAFLIRAKGTRTGGVNNQNPVAVATASKAQASINESITFDGSQSYDNDGQITQYLWEFGDGNSSTQSTVTHSYSNSGTYNIKLTVTDNLGATGTATGQITVSGGGGGNQNPVAVATASKAQASINESISFDGSQSYDNDGQISQYLWEFGDGNSSTQSTVTHSYSNSGTYNIKLTVTDNLGATGNATGQIVISGSNQNVVTANPASGTIAPGGSQTITLTLDAQNLGVGSYTGQVSISSNGGSITIPIDYLVNVEKISSPPNEFTLSQNYPNPFNPSTIIEFSIPQSSEVSLKIYDMLGKEVVNLVEEQKSAGQYRVNFDGSALSSGIYFYKLEADNFKASRKMLLIK